MIHSETARARPTSETLSSLGFSMSSNNNNIPNNLPNGLSNNLSGNLPGIVKMEDSKMYQDYKLSPYQMQSNSWNQHPSQLPTLSYHHSPQHSNMEPTTMGWAQPGMHATSMASQQSLPQPTHHNLYSHYPSTSHHQTSHHSIRPSSSQPMTPQLTPGSLSHPMSLPPVDAVAMAHSHQHNGRYSANSIPPVPHQVVGQQGIRGVLPSASGDPSSPDEPCEPEMDDKDGTWPCKCCGKRYRHAKHLRRHHARHTGDTPYECPLCSRRFGRSDVLKRHYQKCATRRGEPVGDHLAGQRGHPRRQRARNSHSRSDPTTPRDNMPPTMGYTLHGNPMNGASMNGHSLNGHSLNGHSLNGTALNGTALNTGGMNGHFNN